MATTYGKVKRLVSDKGFGFIEVEGEGRRGRNDDIFFHRSAVRGGAAFEQLREGDRVVLEVGNGPKGPRAEFVSTDLGDDQGD